MNDVIELPFDAPTIVRPTTARTLQEQFEEFHRLNPWVMGRLIALTQDLVARGRNKVGIGMLFEVIRWQYWRSTDDPNSDFKLNNNYRSRYARWIMQEIPSLRGVYEVRELKTP